MDTVGQTSSGTVEVMGQDRQVARAQRVARAKREGLLDGLATLFAPFRYQPPVKRRVRTRSHSACEDLRALEDDARRVLHGS